MNRKVSSYALVVIFVSLIVIIDADIPSFIHVCHRNDPKINNCILEAVNHFIPYLRNGISELGIPGMEPLRINTILLANGEDHMHTKLELRNVDVYGASDFQLKRVKVNNSNMVYKIFTTLNHLQFVGDFYVDTKLLAIPIKGNGKFDANTTSCECIAILKGARIKDNGVERMNFTSLTVRLKINNYNIKLEDLVKNNAVMNEAISDLINHDKDNLLQISTPLIEARAEEVILRIANNIVKHFTFDEIFPI